MAHDELGAHMRDELGITEIATARPYQAAGTSAVSFTAGALLPLLAVTFAPASARVIVTAVVAIAALDRTGRLVRVRRRRTMDAGRGARRGLVVGRDGDDVRHRPRCQRTRRLAVSWRTNFHFDPDTYLAMIREEVPDYDTLQSEIGRLVRESNAADAPRVLDLGGGTGSTSRAVLDARPGATVVLVDENPSMLAVARDFLPAANIEQTVVADLADPLPDGPFDLVVSALAVHHLESAQKRALFASVRDLLAPGGRLALADVVVPVDPADAVTPLSPGYDMPDSAADLLGWLRAAGFTADTVWARRDLAVFVADA